jgi:hypothetical protein
VSVFFQKSLAAFLEEARACGPEGVEVAATFEREAAQFYCPAHPEPDTGCVVCFSQGEGLSLLCFGCAPPRWGTFTVSFKAAPAPKTLPPPGTQLSLFGEPAPTEAA